jgi:competence protein ComEA
MALVESPPRAHGRARHAPRKVASLAPDGGGRLATPAAEGAFARLAEALKKSVWTPILLRGLGIVAGMLALAAIGASSIARGSGVPAAVPSAHAGPRVAAAGVTPFAQAADAGQAPSTVDAGSDAGTASAGITPDGKVILNLAGPDELRRIPGVGPKRAEAILELRKKLGGRFKRVTDLLRVKGIGQKSLKKMEPHLVLDAPKAAP